jgi:DNA transposition AAA+ family ATPase
MSTATSAPVGAVTTVDDEFTSERQSNRIPAYKVIDATKALDEDSARAIRWLHSHYYDTGLGLAAVGEAVGYDGSTVSRVFHGRYEGDVAQVVRSILRFRALLEERQSVKRAPFVETALYREIEECCQMALTYQRIVFLYGESQVGKTTCLKHYAQEHNHGETVFLEMPVGGSLSHFLEVLAPKLRMSRQREGALEVNIMRSLGPNNLLIVDEVSRAMQARAYGGRALKTMDFLRALHDNTGCGLVLCGTNVFRDQMADKTLEKFLNQLNRRCLLRRQLPDQPSKADLNAFARHFGLEPASGEAFALQKQVIGDHGLGVCLTTLTAAARKAQKKQDAMTWEHVLKAHAFFRRMEQPAKITDEREAA